MQSHLRTMRSSHSSSRAVVATFRTVQELSRRRFTTTAPLRHNDVDKSTGSSVVASASALRHHRDHTLVPLLAAKKHKLAALEAIKQRCDTETEETSDRYMFAIFAFLVAQCVILFDWTYIHFDWTLTEPITYLCGYSATWIALFWYGNKQKEFSFDGFREYVGDQRRAKLYKANQLDILAYTQLQKDVVQLEARLRTLSSL